MTKPTPDGSYLKTEISAGDGTFFNADQLFHIAVSAYGRFAAVGDDKEGGHGEALIAILFAAATLEAFIMELARAMKADARIGYGELLALATLIEEAETAKGSTPLKFNVAKFALSGETYDRGSQPYQGFAVLFDVRNELVHMKPQSVLPIEAESGDVHRIVKKLHAMGLCHSLEQGLLQSWLMPVSTKAVARWACNVVADMVHSLKNHLPADKPGKPPLFTRLWCGAFGRVK